MARIAIMGTLLAAAIPRVMAVPLAKDLHSDGLQAQHDCKPLLLEFSDAGCSYCHLLETEVLNPTLLNRDYDRRVLMRKLLIDSPANLKDFDGLTRLSARQLAQRYKVRVTPTLLFVDASGEELTERMVGVTTLEMYGGYLDRSLDASREKLRERPRCSE
jgi:thioredoxin-related protein